MSTEHSHIPLISSITFPEISSMRMGLVGTETKNLQFSSEGITQDSSSQVSKHFLLDNSEGITHNTKIAVSNDYGGLLVVLRLRKCIDSLNLFIPEQSVLDYGCGFGWYTNLANSKKCRVTGIDIDAKSIDIAKKTYPDLNINYCATNDISSFGTFDLVFTNMVVCNIQRDDINAFLHRCLHVLKSDGKLFLTNCDININFIDGDLVKHTFDENKEKLVSNQLLEGEQVYVSLLRDDISHTLVNKYSDAWVNYSWSRSELLYLIKKVGFQNISIHDMDIRESSYSYYYIIAYS